RDLQFLCTSNFVQFVTPPIRHGVSPYSDGNAARYSSSLTCSSQSTTLPSSASWIAIWLMPVIAVAPCQCFSPGGHTTTSPARISRLAPPQHFTQPHPEVTTNLWPSGW